MSQQFSFDLPEPKIKQHKTPDDFRPVDDYPELTGVVALDTETDDPGIQNKTGPSWAFHGEGFICGASIAWQGGSFYAGVQHSGGNSDPEKFWRWLKAQAAKPDVAFVYANAIYDLGWLARYGIEPLNAPLS